MKIIGVELKKIGIGNFFPKEGKIELAITFNDGSDKEIFKVINTSEPEEVAEAIIHDLKKLERTIHESEDQKYLTDSLNIVIKEEDMLIKEISQFVQEAGRKLEEISNLKVAEGYIDKIRKLKGLKIEF